ncbi:MAG: branched-chain amino acid ABC transporter permease, partial [Mycobacteriales bacterium]
MSAFITFTVFGLVSGGAYAIAASGLVLTYTTSRVFNVGHGAVGMLMAFVYWQLHVHDAIPNILAVPLVVLVIAPLFGAVIQRLMMRRMSDAPVSVSLVVTVALLVGLIGAAQQLWKPAARSVAGFPPGGFHIGQAFVTWNQALTIGMAGVVAIALYVLLNRTRTGIAMRAVVDNRDLLSLHGARPQVLSSLSWAIGSSLAALAGVLLVPQVGVDYFALTLLVINAYAAAMLGRLQSLPLTYLGALALGLLQTYAQGYLPLPGVLQVGLIPAIPTLFLFAIIVLLPQAQLRVGQLKGIKSVPIPSWSRAGVCGLVLFAVVVVGSGLLSQAQTFDLSLGMCDALLMLSLVLLTGYGGFVSLAQFSFAGIAAVAVAKVLPGSPLSILVGVAVAAAVGALVAIPVLRLRGLYLALATLAFAQLMDKLVFQANFAFGFNGAL